LTNIVDNVIETNNEAVDFFEEKIDAIRLARKLSNISAFEAASPKLRQAAVQALGSYAFTVK